MDNNTQKYTTKNGMATIEVCRKFNALRGDHLWIKFSKAAEKDQTIYNCTVVMTVNNRHKEAVRESIVLKKSYADGYLRMPLKSNKEYSIWINTQTYNGRKDKVDGLEIPIVTRFSTEGEIIRAGAYTKRDISYTSMPTPP